MTVSRYRVRLLPNPPLAFDPETDRWRDIEVDESHTLAAFHEAIFDAFERWDPHGYEFITRDDAGDPLRSYLHPHLYDDGPSVTSKTVEEIDRIIAQDLPNDISEDVTQQLRELQSTRPPERNAADTAIDDLDPEELERLSYTFDSGGNWEHSIEIRETRAESLEGKSIVVGKQGAAPPQYPGEVTDTDGT